MTRKPTLKDVAQAAGVSEMTASRALRNVGDVSEGTRERIRQIASRLDYVPNRIAGALASKSVNLVGVIFPSLSSFVFPEVLAGITKSLSGSELQPVIGVSGYDLESEEKVIREMLSWRPRGLIIAGLEHSDAARRMLKASEIPIVEIMDIDGEPVDYCVGISHHKAGRMMAEEILAHGYRKIGFIGTKMPFDFRARKRLSGFTEVLAAKGLETVAQELYEGSSSFAKGRELTANMLSGNPDLECIYFSSDVMAIGGLMHCLAEGLRVPEDLALAGFNNLEALNGLPVDLATTNSFRFEIGRAAASIVLSASDKKAADPERLTVFDPVVLTGKSL